MPKKKIKVTDLTLFSGISYIDNAVDVVGSLQASQPEMFTQLISNLIVSVIECNGVLYPAEHWPLIKYLQSVAPEKTIAIAVKCKCKTDSELKGYLSADLFFTALLPNPMNMAMVHQQELSQSLHFPYELTMRENADIYHCDHSIFSHAKTKCCTRNKIAIPTLDETFAPQIVNDDFEF